MARQSRICEARSDGAPCTSPMAQGPTASLSRLAYRIGKPGPRSWQTNRPRLNRLTYAFSKKLENLEAAFSMFAAYHNFCWRTRKPGKSGKRRPTAAHMAGLTDHTWTFDELFVAVLG